MPLPTFARIRPPLPTTPTTAKMPKNKCGLVNDPFKQTIKWGGKDERNSSKKPRRSRSPKRRSRSPRRRSRSHSRDRQRYRHRTPEKREKRDARDTITERHCEPRQRAQRTVSNINRIKGLERIIEHRDAQILELKTSLKKREYQYEEMKRRAMSYKHQAKATPMMPQVQYGMPYMNQAQFLPPMPRTIFPASISNESISADHIK